jgi:fatty acid desaturase
MHECAHNTLFSSSRKNKFWGNFCGYFLASDFLAYKRNHWIHHQIYGEPGDPQGNDYMGLKDKRFVGMIIFLLRPLIGWNIFKLIAFNKSKKTPKKSAIFVKRIAFTGLIQFVLGLLSSNFLKHPLLFFLYPIGAATFALFFAQLRGFIEHISPHAIKNNNEKFVRTHLPNFFDNLFLYDLNFNYHVEHHLNPSIPACHLPTLFEEKFYIEKDPEKFYFSFSKSSFETLSLIMREKMGEKYEN